MTHNKIPEENGKKGSSTTSFVVSCCLVCFISFVVVMALSGAGLTDGQIGDIPFRFTM